MQRDHALQAQTNQLFGGPDIGFPRGRVVLEVRRTGAVMDDGVDFIEDGGLVFFG